jgi:hypothetical protein
MSGLETAALITVAAWLAVLSMAVLVLVRQIGLLSAWAERNTHSRDDGLDVGVSVPEPARELLPELTAGLGYVVFLAGNCQPCREFALEASRSSEVAELRDAVRIAAVVTGDDVQADEVARMLPAWIEVLQHDAAALLTQTFEVRTTPAVYEVDRGTVTGRAVAGYGLINFLNLVDARATSDAAAIADRRMQPLQVHQTEGAGTGG